MATTRSARRRCPRCGKVSHASRWSLARCAACLYVADRLREPSTWRGVVIVATALGFHFAPEQREAVLSVGLFAAGLLGAVLGDHHKQRRK